MQNDITHTYFYPFPPTKVWEFLTNPELMSQWLMPTDFEPILGFPFQFKTRPIPPMDFDGIVYCTVLEIVPPKRLSYSWKSGPGEGKITLDSVVVWTLAEKDNGTELLLVHSGFTEADNLALYNGLNAGWLGNMKKIADRLNA